MQRTRQREPNLVFFCEICTVHPSCVDSVNTASDETDMNVFCSTECKRNYSDKYLNLLFIVEIYKN